MQSLRETAGCWLPVAAASILFGIAGPGPAAAEPLRVEAVDEAPQNAEFEAWRAALLEAVRSRDTDFVVAQAAPDIKLSFGDIYGQDSFREALTGDADWQGDAYWRELQAALELGGVFMEDGAFCTPYLSCIDVPGCPDCDPYETVYVTKPEAVARSSPEGMASVAAWLSWDVLQLDYEKESPEGWYAVKLANGNTGYIAYDDARMAIDYRARFEEAAGKWRMTVFIAGD